MTEDLSAKINLQKEKLSNDSRKLDQKDRELDMQMSRDNFDKVAKAEDLRIKNKVANKPTSSGK